MIIDPSLLLYDYPLCKVCLSSKTEKIIRNRDGWGAARKTECRDTELYNISEYQLNNGY